QPVRRLLPVPPGAARALVPPLAPPDPGGQDRLLRLPQPARLDGAEPAREADAERDLLPVPRGEARALPLGASARPRGLRELPRAARLEPPRAAREPDAAAVPAVPHVRLPPEHGVHGRKRVGGHPAAPPPP